MLNRLHDAGSKDHSSDDLFIQSLQAVLLNPDHFRPGLLKRHKPIWRTYFADAARKKLTANQLVVLQIVGEGVKLHFVNPNSLGQTAVPDYAKKRRVLRKLVCYDKRRPTGTPSHSL